MNAPQRITDLARADTSQPASDLSQFFAIFFEEAAEHLAEMESRLLALDLAAADDEELNAIFRAAHSVKGGAATFGFADMAAVTHELESLLDRARKHELHLTTAMVDALLEAGDVLKCQLAIHRGEGVAAPDAVGCCAQIRSLLDPLPATPMPGMPAVESQSSGTTEWRLGYRQPKRKADRLAVEQVLNRLNEDGSLEDETDAPVKRGYRQIRLRSSLSQEALLDGLAFALAIEDIHLEPIGPAELEPDANHANPATDDGFGLFDDAPGTPPPSDPGFGLFADEPVVTLSTEPITPATHGRRVTDQPVMAPTEGGRRSSDRAAAGGAADMASIRVSVEKVDQLINLVGELVITQAMLAQNVGLAGPQAGRIDAGVAQLERNTRDLQEAVMSIRMMPISFVFNRFPRVVRDLAAKLGKQVELRLVGESTELDKGLIEKLADPLNHLVRNSLDHGIESCEQRLAAGKPAHGTVTLRAFHQGGSIVIEVADDGGGLHRGRILAKARERGLPVTDTMTDSQVWQLIFEAGFSTAAEVTDVSGRGVGMDVVKRNIQSLGGRVEIQSMEGAGTTTVIRLPLTLAILDGMSVAVGGELYIFPLTCIVESLQPAAAAVKSINGGERIIQVRDEYLPLLALHDVFGTSAGAKPVEESLVVLIEANGRKTALLVDELVGQHQVVIKSLESNYRRVRGLSGATIMGDGKVALILDANALTELASCKSAARPHLPAH